LFISSNPLATLGANNISSEAGALVSLNKQSKPMVLKQYNHEEYLSRI